MRSWWHHEQVSIAAAVAAALHHSAQRGSDARPETHFAPRGQTTATEEEVREVNDALEGQKRPPPGMRPVPLPEVAGPQAAVTVGYVAAGAPSLTVVPVSDDRIDDAALQFLLQQSLLARAEEEEEAREEAEVKVMEEKVDKMMEQLAERVREVARRDGFRLSLNLSNLERTACTFVAHSEGLRKKKEKRKKRRRRIRYRSGFLVSCSS